MHIYKLTINTVIYLFLAAAIFGQTDLVKTEGITNPLHQANIGKITFMSTLIPIENYKETDFLKAFELKETGDLNIRVFMDNSLTNYLHRLAPSLTAEELVKNGNYQFLFFVDGALVYKENVFASAYAIENKNTKTILQLSLMNSTNEETGGSALWRRFLLNGGDEALTEGTHSLKIELRPYLKTPELKVGNLIARGELQLTVIKPKIDEKQIAIQLIEPNSGWKISKDAYDKKRIRELNRKIAENFYKEIKSIIVIKDGKLLIEEYFNGATRDTLHNTRSVGKSFASAMMGIAINDGYIKSEDQTLKEFYDLKKFANYAPKKEGVTIKSLLTMSSGFDADDDNEESPGNEENMYPTSDWVKFALDLSMDNKKEVGNTWNYFTAGVIILGDIINKSVPGGLEKYAENKLFKPLSIKKYEWPYTPQKVASTAGGLQMSSLDFAKFGQLYKNGGRWHGKQIIPRHWVDKTFTKYLPVPYGENAHYGYLFWNITYNVNNKPYEAFYATGNGGNKIFVFKDQPLVVVITTTAYGKSWAHPQANRIMERYILPAVSNERALRMKHPTPSSQASMKAMLSRRRVR
ncbi:MAG: serine hydrolase [Pyrinomonadaceae bacterium]|nr:serine hydrolase [Pyrinomonadaceae bacterium]